MLPLEPGLWFPSTWMLTGYCVSLFLDQPSSQHVSISGFVSKMVSNSRLFAMDDSHSSTIELIIGPGNDWSLIFMLPTSHWMATDQRVNRDSYIQDLPKITDRSSRVGIQPGLIRRAFLRPLLLSSARAEGGCDPS